MASNEEQEKKSEGRVVQLSGTIRGKSEDGTQKRERNDGEE